jgi:Spy/CpxP family protein refolding chaperone
MMRLALWAPLAGALAIGAALAQSHSPHAGLETRGVKTLSDEQVADLRAGRGMRLALAAELNGYPGPLHVLELADRLDLSASQRAEVEELHARMKAEASPLGERLIAEEAKLNEQFAARAITPASLTAATEQIGRTRAALRAAHLRHHLSTLDVVTARQAELYAELRGYAKGTQHRPQRHHP